MKGFVWDGMGWREMIGENVGWKYIHREGLAWGRGWRVREIWVGNFSLVWPGPPEDHVIGAQTRVEEREICCEKSK
jgi:hypothetical protein